MANAVININFATVQEAQAGILTDKSINPATLKQAISASQIRRNNYVYVVPTGSVATGSTTIAGADFYGNTLSVDQVNTEVYLNGIHLVNALDYNITNASTITLTDSVSAGDVVDVVYYQII